MNRSKTFIPASLIARLVLAGVFLGLAVWSMLGLRERLSIEALVDEEAEAVLALVADGLPAGRNAYWYDAIGTRLVALGADHAVIASEAYERAVAREPRDGHLWLRLTWARYLAAGRFDESVAEALEASFARLPYGELEYRRWRIQFCDDVWFSLPEHLREAALREARIENENWVRRNTLMIASELGLRN